MKVLGRKHPEVSAIFGLIWEWECQAKYGVAEAMHGRALKESDWARTSRDAYQHILHKQKHYSHASELYLRASSGYKKVLGTGHPTFIACIENWSSMIGEIKQHDVLDAEFAI